MSASEQNHIETAVDAGRNAVDASSRVLWMPHPDDDEIRVPVAVDQHGDIALLDEVMRELDQRMPSPAHRDNTVVLTEVESFNAYVKRYADENTLVYAQVSSFGLVAVFDDHPVAPYEAGWRRHRAAYNCPKSPEWQAWSAVDGVPMKQDAFADFVESRLEDMINAGEGFPKPTEVLAVARSLSIRTKGTFQREVNPTNGDHVLVRKQETTSDSTQVPRAFVIAIPVFEGGTRYQVECRIRMTVGDHGAAFAVVMHRRKETERDAFNGVRTIIATETGRLILAGSP